MRWAASLDMYRKVPMDLLEGTKRGSILSYMAVFAMALLFFLETRAFLSSRWGVHLALDNNDEERVRVNFNITMMDLKCEYATIDVVSVLGTDQNVTSHIFKWDLDADGVRRGFSGRNRQQIDISLKDDAVKETIDELLVNGEDAVSLDQQTFNFALNENEYLFLDFYAPWCSHCRDLAPTWETLAEVMDAAAEQVVMENIEQHGHDYTPEQFLHAKRVEKPVMIAKIDCVLHLEFCRSQRIRAYPTLRFYIDGEFDQDYRGHRTVVEMADWLTAKEQEHKEDLQRDTKKVQKAAEAARKRMDVSAEEKEWEEKVKMHRHRNNRRIWNAEDHPGCQMSGHLMLDRVPGNFHIQARSANHDLVPHMTNVSHVVNSLTIGEPMVQRMIETNHVFVPDDVKSKFSPMNGNVYVTNALHEAYHHYLKVITTNFEGVPKVANYKRNLKAYQLLQNSQLSYYRNDVVPEAKFIYDLSPISVKYEKRGRHWYDYLTSLMAIIGGTFTMVGMVESGINAAVHRKRRYR